MITGRDDRFEATDPTLCYTPKLADNLAAFHMLDVEVLQQHLATASAEESLALFSNRCRGGVNTYLQVITSQATAIQNECNDIDIQRRRMGTSVLLIKALGRGCTTAASSKV
jgi:outer membrane protein TolC